MNDRSRVPEALGVPDLEVGRGASGLQQRLDHVERGRDAGCDGAGQATGYAVRGRVVLLARVDDLGNGLVRGELHGRKGDRHGQGCRVGHVEGRQALGAVDGLGAVVDGSVDGAVNLHALLDDWMYPLATRC